MVEWTVSMTGEEQEQMNLLRAEYSEHRKKLLHYMAYLEDKYGGDKWDYWGPANLEDKYE